MAELQTECVGVEPRAGGGDATSFVARWAGKFEPSARHGDPRYERLARKYGL